jgi:hypothetical protein
MHLYSFYSIGMRNYFVIYCLLLNCLLLAGLAACRKQPLEVSPSPAFVQTLPAKGATGVGWLPVFSWQASSGATGYDLLVSTSSSYADPVIDQTGLNDTLFTAQTVLAANTQYYWKVVARTAGGQILATNAGIAFTTAPVPVRTSRYYVDPAGTDSPENGTRERPFKTLAYAASQVAADTGDTILLAAGTYPETRPSWVATGVNIIGAGEGKTVLTAGALPGESDNPDWFEGSLLLLVSPHNQTPHDPKSLVLPPKNGNQVVSGLTIDGSGKSLKAGVWVENRNNVTMHDVTIKNCRQRGAVFATGVKEWFVYPKYWMENTRIFNCTFLNCGKDLPDQTLGNLCLAGLNGADIHHIFITDTEGYGIKFIYDGFFKNTTIHDCTITVSESDAKWGEDISIELWNVGAGNQIHAIGCNTWLSVVNHPEMFGSVAGSENMKIYQVRIIDRDGNSNKEAIEVAAPGVEVYDSYFENKGIGLAVWDMGRNNIYIHNNIFYNTTPKSNWASGAAVYIDNSRNWDFDQMRIDNNVLDTYSVAIKIKGSRISRIKIRNNVFLNTTLADLEAVGDSIAFENNLKHTPSATPWMVTGASIKKQNLTGDPGFKKSGNRWESFYAPASAASLVVDKGRYVGLPYAGAAPDMGCFEYK